MNKYRKELYTTMFNALRHDVRRKTLLLLSKEDRSFTSLYETLGISSSHLTYHLEALDGLIYKSHSGYTLSRYGCAAVEIMNNVENPYSLKKDSLQYYHMLYGERDHRKTLLGLLLVTLLFITGLYVNLHQTYASQIDTLEKKDYVIATLNTELSAKKDLSGLEGICQRPGTHITSYYTLSYYGGKPDPGIPDMNSVLVFYAPEGGLTLKLQFICRLPEGAYIPLTIQDGIASKYDISSRIISEEVITNVHREYQSPVVASKRITNLDHEFHVTLKSKGWYTISLLGPIRIRHLDGAYMNLDWFDQGLWAGKESAKVWASCQMTKNGEAALFVIETN